MQRFEQIYAEQHDPVRAYVRRRVAEDAVDDVVSETFLVCWRKLDRVPDDPLPWLYAVARKTIANHRRKLARQAPPRAAVGGDPEPVGDGALAAAFAALSERDREVLRLVAWEGLSLREASVVLGSPPSHAAFGTTAPSRGSHRGSKPLCPFDPSQKE
jgi:RNA polymerase sigma-70 factor, ECF subfamily